MRKILCLLGILFVGIPNLAAQEFDFAFNGSTVKDGVLNVKLNTNDFTPFWSIEEIEEMVRESFALLNTISTASSRANYDGPTNLPCDNATKNVFVLCFKGTEATGGKAALTFRLTSAGSVLGAIVYLNSGKKYDRNTLVAVITHEIGHILGLDHSGKYPSIMSEFLKAGVKASLSEYDIAALTHLYPFDLDRSEVRLSQDLMLDLPYIWVGDTMYRATLQLNGTSEFELKTAEIQELPVSELGFKFIASTGTIHIASVWYDSVVQGERGRYFLNLRLKPSNPLALTLHAPPVFEVVSYGAISSP